MKVFFPFAATLILATLNFQCSKSSSSSLKSTIPIVGELPWATQTVRGLGTSLPGALGKMFQVADEAKDQRFTCSDGKIPKARDCIVKANASNDSIMCSYLAQSLPDKLKVYCEITASAWPQLAPELANIVVPEFIRLNFAKGSSFTSSSTYGKMSCQETGGSWQCSFDRFVGLDKSITIAKKQSVIVPEGLKDEFGSPLPTRSKDYRLNLLSGSIQVSSYRSSDDILAEFTKTVADKEDLPVYEESEAANCKEAEQLALTYYTANGYQIINSGLRKHARGEKLDREVEMSILAAISGLNCFPQVQEKFVIRGATLSPEKLAKYQKDAIIVEHAFTSTSINHEVTYDFKGNSEFRIIEARGADLSDFGVGSDSGEKEFLIAPGTLFKVLDRRVDGETTIIELQQLQ